MAVQNEGSHTAEPSYICPYCKTEYNNLQSEEAQSVPLKIALPRTASIPPGEGTRDK